MSEQKADVVWRSGTIITMVENRPLERAAVEGFLGELTGNILRAKGFVRLINDPDRLHLLQLVG